ncbi:hypothetical protein AtubIFM54640_010133 [Aspergillus tubingensis]|nr:hypothetical protein AtubIFM54640_010133 [Aspergillus tubingensis]
MIRLRLLYVALYRVKQELQPEHQYDYYVSNYIAQAIFQAGCVDHQPDVINANVRSWINLGERYHLIAEDLGGLGALYILPDIGGESLWAKELPKSATNQSRKYVIQNLKNQGFCEEARRRNLHVLAEKEVSRILKPLKEALKFGFTPNLTGTGQISAQGRSQINTQPNEMPPNALQDFQSSEAQQPVIVFARNQPDCALFHPTTQNEDELIQRPVGIEAETFNLQSFMQQAPVHGTHRGPGEQSYSLHAVTPGVNQVTQSVELDGGRFNFQPFIQQAPVHGTKRGLEEQPYTLHGVQPGMNLARQSLELELDGGSFNFQPFIQQPPLRGSQGDPGPLLYSPDAATLGGTPIDQVASNPDAGPLDLHAFIQQPLDCESQGVFTYQSYDRNAVTTMDQFSRLSYAAGSTAFSPDHYYHRSEHRS